MKTTGSCIKTRRLMVRETCVSIDFQIPSSLNVAAKFLVDFFSFPKKNCSPKDRGRNEFRDLVSSRISKFHACKEDARVYDVNPREITTFHGAFHWRKISPFREPLG